MLQGYRIEPLTDKTACTRPPIDDSLVVAAKFAASMLMLGICQLFPGWLLTYLEKCGINKLPKFAR
jgi:hypothetical protein